jgi:hypothetical protein
MMANLVRKNANFSPEIITGILLKPWLANVDHSAPAAVYSGAGIRYVDCEYGNRSSDTHCIKNILNDRCHCLTDGIPGTMWISKATLDYFEFLRKFRSRQKHVYAWIIQHHRFFGKDGPSRKSGYC